MKRFIDTIIDQLSDTTNPYDSLSEDLNNASEMYPNTTPLEGSAETKPAEVPITKEVEVNDKKDPGAEYDLFSAKKQLEDITRQIKAHHEDGLKHWGQENHEVAAEIANSIQNLKTQAIKLGREIHELENAPKDEKK